MSDTVKLQQDYEAIERALHHLIKHGHVSITEPALDGLRRMWQRVVDAETAQVTDEQLDVAVAVYKKRSIPVGGDVDGAIRKLIIEIAAAQQGDSHEEAN